MKINTINWCTWNQIKYHPFPSYLSLIMEVLEPLKGLLQDVGDPLFLQAFPPSLRGNTRLCSNPNQTDELTSQSQPICCTASYRRKCNTFTNPWPWCVCHVRLEGSTLHLPGSTVPCIVHCFNANARPSTCNTKASMIYGTVQVIPRPRLLRPERVWDGR